MIHRYDLMVCLDGGEVAAYPDTETADALERAYALKQEHHDGVVSIVFTDTEERLVALDALSRLDEAIATEDEDLHATVAQLADDLRKSLHNTDERSNDV